MPRLTKEQEFVSYVLDLMQSIGPVEARRIFGSHGMFLEGLMFALISKNTLYLKADKQTREDFLNLGLEVFTYQRQGKDMTLSYYQAPEETLEHVDEMNIWANKAYGAALRKALKNSKGRG